jgi:hypothetical protein
MSRPQICAGRLTCSRGDVAPRHVPLLLAGNSRLHASRILASIDVLGVVGAGQSRFPCGSTTPSATQSNPIRGRP